MALVKNNLIVEDKWSLLGDEDSLPEGDVIVSLTYWQENREALLARSGGLGLILRSDENPEEILGDLQFFQLIALDFPAYTDGRAYSYARLLRERHNFDGELRAVGDVLRDQVFLMSRCGFDAFVIDAQDQKALQIWLDAQKDFTTFYQPTGDGRKTVSSLRQRRRVARAAS
ncbi:DUF934 domain-containing protein [Terasakiella sp. SH-1]|uniref:DUF934 domain-containing protein n=1 Tax=Terasakiella sp. SH-1 TaxID=2560057 RepID=UPI0010735585|nr:DUF934 domain-containing protein [Terasakiella sp. SH-1]